MTEWPYIYFWNRMGRKGRRCRVLLRARAMNTCLLEFEDGYRAITSRNALRKSAEPADTRKGASPALDVNHE